MRKATFGSLALLLVSVPAPSVAEEAAYEDIQDESLTVNQLRALHSRFDQNGDSKVSLDEVLAFARHIGRGIASKDVMSILDELDTSKDGKLSLEEHLEDISKQADGGDAEEMQELEMRKEFEAAKHAAADVNQDGYLDAEELPGLYYPETADAVLSVTVEETMRQKDSNRDGRLNIREFFEVAPEEENEDVTDEEGWDFNQLDADTDGFLDLGELREWESGRYHTREALKKLFEFADKDKDMHLTADEMADAKDMIAVSDTQYHLIEWAEHLEL